MKLVGLTGGIACGKSTVAAMLHDTFPVLDCDQIAHDLQEKVQHVCCSDKPQFQIGSVGIPTNGARLWNQHLAP